MPRDWLEGFEEYLNPGEALSEKDIAESFMPDFSKVPDNEMGVKIYHGDGAPMSPGFPDNEEGREALLRFAAENISTWAGKYYTDVEGWRHILFVGDCFLIDLRNGTPIPHLSRVAKAAKWQVAFALSDGPRSVSEALKA
jgi:hypothetical protein